MPAKKNRGPISPNNKRMWNGQEVKPTKYYGHNNKGVMAGTIDGELVRDNNGKVIPFRNI